LTEKIALVHTVDFFTPIVDDPYLFGTIAVANALSDVYAMGGIPLTAMNIVCYSPQILGEEIIKEVLRGGLDKMKEAEVILVGGHSIEDPELKYGISVTGIVHPEKIITNKGAKIGDHIILTKPLGTGVVSTALKAQMACDDAIRQMVETMSILNRSASELMQKIGVNACTDVTGFGLVGHLFEVSRASKKKIKIFSENIPTLPYSLEYIKMGLVPAGCHTNRRFYEPFVKYKKELPIELRDLLYDPQTSGGLLIFIEENKAPILLRKLKELYPCACLIGTVEDNQEGIIVE